MSPSARAPTKAWSHGGGHRARRALNLHSHASQGLLDRDTPAHGFQQLRACPSISAGVPSRAAAAAQLWDGAQPLAEAAAAAQQLPRKRLVPLDEEEQGGDFADWQRGPRKLRAREGLIREGMAALQI
jgi:hypothetical protein